MEDSKKELNMEEIQDVSGGSGGHATIKDYQSIAGRRKCKMVRLYTFGNVIIASVSSGTRGIQTPASA